MTTTVQIEGNSIFLNGKSIDQVIADAVEAGVSRVLNSKKEDPLELVKVAELAEKFNCHPRTITRRILENNIRTQKIGKHTCVFRKDANKLLI